MGAIDEFASDLNSMLADIDNTFKTLSDRKNQLQRKGNDVAQRWAEHFDAMNKSMTDAEAALNRISNVPISSSPPQTPANIALSQVPKLNP